MTPTKTRLRTTGLTLAAGALSLAGTMASADIQHLDDVIISFSLCVGNDCVNGESFGFDTVRLKENNTRLHFDDTSNSASFPRNDWRFVANDSSNGGGSYMAIEDSTAGRQVFRVDAGAPSNSLRIDSGGDVGIGESNPVVELHIQDGDSPTVRLEQDGSSGFTAQTFDIVGNEANFFIRDVTNGSKLFFRSKPGAPENSLFIDAGGRVGLGLDPNDNANLHIRDTDGRVQLWFDEPTTSNGREMKLELANETFDVSFNGTGSPELQVFASGDVRVVRGDLYVDDGNNLSGGDLIVTGSISSGGQTLIVPDYVFAPDYELMPLYEVEKFIVENRHLPKIPSATQINSGMLNMTEMQMSLLEKVEELTLYTLQQQKTIDALSARLETLAD